MFQLSWWGPALPWWRRESCRGHQRSWTGKPLPFCMVRLTPLFLYSYPRERTVENSRLFQLDHTLSEPCSTYSRLGFFQGAIRHWKAVGYFAFTGLWDAWMESRPRRFQWIMKRGVAKEAGNRSQYHFCPGSNSVTLSKSLSHFYSHFLHL